MDVSTGELYRFPPEALIQGSSPVIRKESLRAARLVQISKKPCITSAQLLATARLQLPGRVAWEERGSSHALRAYAVGRATKP